VKLPPIPSKPLGLDWRGVFGEGGGGVGSAAEVAEEMAFLEMCGKLNSEGAKMRRQWKKNMSSESRTVRGQGMEEHDGLLRRHLSRFMDEGGQGWLWEGGLAAAVGGGRAGATAAVGERR